jgi:hypothetical protein
MAAGVTTTTQIDNAVRKFLAESRYTLQERPGVVKSSIRVETLPENQGPTIYIPKFSTVTTYALTEGIDMTQAQQITDTNMTLTPTEFGAQVVLSDLMLMESKDEFFRVAGRILAESYDRQQDQTLCDDLDNFSNALGSAGTALALGHVMAAHAGIKYGTPASGAGRGGEPGPDPVSCIVTPAQAHSLKKTLVGHVSGAVVLSSGGTAAAPSPPAVDRATLSEQFDAGGVVVKTDVNIIKDASDDAKGGVISKEAVILAQLGSEPSVERERDASLRAWELNFVGRWARGEYNDAWGAEMLFDSATPTS